MKGIKSLSMMVAIAFLFLIGQVFLPVSVLAKDGEKNQSKSDYALYDGTNPLNQGPAGTANQAGVGVAGALCGVGVPKDNDSKDNKDKTKHGNAANGPFTVHISVTNHISSPVDGYVRVTYFDGDWVEYPIAKGGVLNLTLVGGSKGGGDKAVRVSGRPGGPNGVRLVGQMSILSENGPAFCLSCDAGSDEDVGCDAIIPD